MLYIYKFTNKINGKVYIEQTNNLSKRINGHKSEAFNPKANGYKLPFHNAIRKYGLENFDFEVLEEIDDVFGRDYLNEREIFFIDYYKSLTHQNGYNLTKGGNGCAKRPLSFEEQVSLSKIFNIQQVKEIQQMLLDGYEYFEIKRKFPCLTTSFLSNINTGQNFIREDLSYPLCTLHTKFEKDTKEKIIQDIINNVPYSEISNKYGISPGYVSAINNGKRWKNEKYSYPLCKKTCVEGAYSHDLKKDLIFTKISHNELAKKYNKSKSTITAINVGRNRRDNRFKYPLRDNCEENKKIWSTLF